MQKNILRHLHSQNMLWICFRIHSKEVAMLYTVLLVILILLLLGALPTWPYSAGWGYYPSGGLGLVVIILIILLLAGRL